MELLTDTNTFSLTIARVDATLDINPPLAAAKFDNASTDPSALRDQLLTAVTARAGEVEAAEWALDQATAACDVQMAAALAAGLPPQRIAAAAGVCVSALPQATPGTLLAAG